MGNPQGMREVCIIGGIDDEPAQKVIDLVEDAHLLVQCSLNAEWVAISDLLSGRISVDLRRRVSETGPLCNRVSYFPLLTCERSIVV